MRVHRGYSVPSTRASLMSSPSTPSLACALLLMASVIHFPLPIPLSCPLLLLILLSACPLPIHSLRIPLAQFVFHPHLRLLLSLPIPRLQIPLAIPIRIRTLPYSAYLMPPLHHACSIRSLAAVFIIGKLLKRAQISSSRARRDGTWCSLKCIRHAGHVEAVRGICGVCVILATVEVVARAAQKRSTK